MSSATPEDGATAATAVSKQLGMRKNGMPSPQKIYTSGSTLIPIIYTGKQWHEPRKAFRPASGLTSYEKRAKDRVAQALVKAKEKELKDEKESERQVRWFIHQGALAIRTVDWLVSPMQRRITALKERRAAKEEKERYEKMAEKMHKKRVERLKRKEKRNRLINSWWDGIRHPL
jgi:rRNA-processing protein CGR1